MLKERRRMSKAQCESGFFESSRDSFYYEIMLDAKTEYRI